MKEIISFGFINLKKLNKIVNIQRVINDKKFDEWFNYNYKISEEENKFLKYLINSRKLYLPYYNEQKLSMKFIAPILNKVDFCFANIQDWYSSEISCELNGFLLKGKPYLMVATGIETPEKPYFFLQEYKKSINSKGNPEFQVLAAMITAIELNKNNKIIGSFVIGQYWKFIILEKIEIEKYEYFVSESFDSLKLNDLKKIYNNLQSLKFLYCK